MTREEYLAQIQSPCTFARGTLELTIRITRETMHALSVRLASILTRGPLPKPVLQRVDPTGDYFVVSLNTPELRHIVQILEHLRDAGTLQHDLIGRVIARWRDCLHLTEMHEVSS